MVHEVSRWRPRSTTLGLFFSCFLPFSLRARWRLGSSALCVCVAIERCRRSSTTQSTPARIVPETPPSHAVVPPVVRRTSPPWHGRNTSGRSPAFGRQRARAPDRGVGQRPGRSPIGSGGCSRPERIARSSRPLNARPLPAFPDQPAASKTKPDFFRQPNPFFFCETLPDSPGSTSPKPIARKLRSSRKAVLHLLGPIARTEIGIELSRSWNSNRTTRGNAVPSDGSSRD